MHAHQPLIYTLPTFPYNSEVEKILGISVFTLNKLSRDIDRLLEHIHSNQPRFILGLAQSHKRSTWEQYTINSFHKTKKVVNDSSATLYELYIPTNSLLPIRKKPTTTFCNYAMFRVQYFLQINNLNIPHSFAHVTKEGISTLDQSLSKKHLSTG